MADIGPRQLDPTFLSRLLSFKRRMIKSSTFIYPQGNTTELPGLTVVSMVSHDLERQSDQTHQT
jgi:hypothetical protein